MSGDAAAAALVLRQRWQVECHGADGRLKWREDVFNLIANEGLNDLLERYFRGAAYTAQHFVLLTGGAPTPAAGDTMASHPGWTEVTAYSEGTRPALQMAAPAGQSTSNIANKAAFTINAGATVGGAAIATNSTKGGTIGMLYAVAAFGGGDRVLANGDTLNVTVTATAASA